MLQQEQKARGLRNINKRTSDFLNHYLAGNWED